MLFKAFAYHICNGEMQAVKEKLSNLASSTKEHVNVCKAKVEEKVEKAAARTDEEKGLAEERRKAKETQAKEEQRQAKDKHAAKKLDAANNQHKPQLVAGAHGRQQQHPPVGTAAPMAGSTVPTYPLGGNPPGRNYL